MVKLPVVPVLIIMVEQLEVVMVNDFDIDLQSYFKLANIFCLPSFFKSEAFGVVLIEAMSFGCPQVVFNIKGSGVPWVVENNRTGLVIEKIDSKLLGLKLKLLLSDVTLLENFSKQSIKRYNKFFKKQDMIARTSELYSKLFNNAV